MNLCLESGAIIGVYIMMELCIVFNWLKPIFLKARGIHLIFFVFTWLFPSIFGFQILEFGRWKMNFVFGFWSLDLCIWILELGIWKFDFGFWYGIEADVTNQWAVATQQSRILEGRCSTQHQELSKADNKNGRRYD